MSTINEEQKTVLVALSQLEPASLEELAEKTGLSVGRIKAILKELDQEGLLENANEPEQAE